jgi:F-type H+-transporting ATPase subunit gamma
MAKGSKEIRKRIKSIRNTQQVTKAMKMVAAARLRKSEGRTHASRPYSDTLREVMGNLAAVASEFEHPFLAHIAPDVPKVMLLHLTSDKGLCGSYNTNLNRRALQFVREQREQGRDVVVHCAGKIGGKFARTEGLTVGQRYEAFTDKTSFAELNQIADQLSAAYLSHEVSEVYLNYARFINVVKNEPTVVRLLPLEPIEAAAEEQASGFRQEYDLEPSPEELLDILLPRYFRTQLFQAALESFTSENGARMVAMDNATSAAGEMIDNLTLEYNKARQAGITLEILDIVGGAEALKG